MRKTDLAIAGAAAFVIGAGGAYLATAPSAPRCVRRPFNSGPDVCLRNLTRVSPNLVFPASESTGACIPVECPKAQP